MTDPERLPNAFEVLDHLPHGWGVIYRHFGAADRGIIAAKMRRQTSRRGLRLLIARDPELALEVRADGVHWPQASAYRAKYWRNRFPLMTTSWHGLKPIHPSVATFFGAVIVSTVFASGSPTAGSPFGAHRFRTFASRTSRPAYALGGISADNAIQVSGAGGLAGIDAFRVFGR